MMSDSKQSSSTLPTYTDSIEVMGTVVTIQVCSGRAENKVARVVDKAFNPFFQVVNRFSRFRDDNELAELNRSGGKRCKVSRELFEMVELLLDVAEKTDGVFDPTVIDILEEYGYGKNYRNVDKFELPGGRLAEILEGRPSFREIQLFPKSCEVKLVKGQRIELGAVGKGYAIDLAYEVLEPLENFCINAGGDIRVSGKNAKGELWKAGLQDPDNTSRLVGAVELDSEALGCSGPAARRRGRFHHLIDMKTGRPKAGTKTVFVKAPTAKLADVLATAGFLVGDPRRAKPLESRFPGTDFLLDLSD